MTKQHNISLNSQFTDALDDMNCFSVFCDNSQSILKIRFQVLSFASKKVQEDINVAVIIALYQDFISVF